MLILFTIVYYKANIDFLKARNLLTEKDTIVTAGHIKGLICEIMTILI